LSRKFGMELNISHIIIDRRLQWIGHLGHMGEGRLPKKILFGEMKGKRSRHGTKMRWCDVVVTDLKALEIGW